MAKTLNADRDFDVQILNDVVRGVFAGKNCFMGSALVSGGAVTVNATMPTPKPKEIGNEITVPYFGTLGEFEDNPDGSSSTPKKLSTTNEKSQIARSSLSFEVSTWAQNSGQEDLDPYEEAGRQIQLAAVRRHDKVMVAEAMTTPLVHDIYASSGTPGLLTYDAMVDARSLWGDENQDVVGAVVHSRTMADLRKLKDANGRPLLVESMATDQVTRFAGLPLVESDRCPLDGSVMGTVASSGTTPPVMTITGTPLGPYKLKVRVSGVGLTLGTAKIEFSLNDGQTWSAPVTTATAAVPFALIDGAKDSLIGMNGQSGLSIAFAGNFINVDNAWRAVANLKVRTLLLKKGALAYYYASEHMGLLTDKDILAHTDIAAMHIYHVAHLYRRTPNGTLPGVVAIAHNVSGFRGV